MIKLTRLLSLGALALAGLMEAVSLQAAVIRVTADVTADTTWTADNTYVLDTVIYVRNNAVLTIEPGTVVKGSTTVTTSRDGVPINVSALWVTRGARLMAEGTRQRPIIFTFEEDNVNSISDVALNTSGRWGGIVLCGKGRLNSAKLAAGEAASPKYDRYEGTDTDGIDGAHLFGGNDDTDSSGVLRYVSIRYAGAVFAANSELNSLTMGAVGSGTVISHVEAFNGSDDGFEWWGGTVNTDHLVASFIEDDDFDTDQGYRGVNQFWFGVKPPWNGSSDSRGIESDGDLNQSAAGEQPLSQWTAHNVTLIGRGSVDTAFGGGSAWNARDEAAPNVYNAVVTDFNKGLLLDTDGLAYFTSNPALAELRNSIFNVVTATASANGGFLFTDPAYNNTLENPLLGGVSYAQDYTLNPSPQPGSPALGGVLAQGGGLVATSYRGAFASGDSWADEWTALYQMGFLKGGVPMTDENRDIVFVAGGGTLQLNVDSAPGLIYQLQSTTDLGANPIVWSNEGQAVAGDGAIKSFSQAIGSAGGGKYFRIQVN